MSETELLKQALGWLWSGVVTVGSVLVGVIWKKHQEEIAALKSSIGKVGADMQVYAQGVEKRLDGIERDFTPLARHEATRKEMREGIIDLHDKIEGSSAALAARIDAHAVESSRRHTELMNILLQTKK